MLQSQLCSKTLRYDPSDEQSVNARLLERAGYVQKVMAGVYTYMPLGVRVLVKIENLVREEMNALGAQEVLLPSLHPKELWEQTGRWDNFDALFQIHSRHGADYALGATHEEIVVPAMKRSIQSYADLPRAVYQIQTKFRDEPRAKSGLLRGREFRMKDMYSFHRSHNDLDAFYDKTMESYRKIFVRMGLTAFLTESSGGTFSKYSHEFQVPLTYGEDTIFYCKKCDYAVNKEITEKGGCTKCGAVGEEMRGSEIANIFKLNTTYSDPFKLTAMNEQGDAPLVIMGCYGIGTSRLMGTIVEAYHDDRGIIWPAQLAPYLVHILPLYSSSADTTELIAQRAAVLTHRLEENGIDVLLDDRSTISAGEKFTDSDLIGLPLRVIISEKTIVAGGCELKKRLSDDVVILDADRILDAANELKIRSQL